MENWARRGALRVLGAVTVVLGGALTTTAVRHTDQVVASGRDVLIGDEMVELFAGRNLVSESNTQLAANTVALGDFSVPSGSMRVTRETDQIFAVGGAVSVGDNAAVIFPATGGLTYGTIRSGAVGNNATIVRDTDAVAPYAAMLNGLASSSACFARTPTTGIALRSDDGAVTELIGDGVSALQVFQIDGGVVGDVTFSRVPAHASILLNIVGDHVTWSPRSSSWSDRSADVLVNVPDAARVTVPAVDSLRTNLLVGRVDSAVLVHAEAFRGQLLALGDVTLDGTRMTGTGLTAGHLPRCTGDSLAEFARDPALTIDLKAPISESTVPLVGPITDPTVSAAAADTPDTRPAASSTTTSSTTTTSTTTTTSAPAQGDDEPDDMSGRPVPGAAFALGGAATSSNWWIGLPVALLGGALLAMSWIGAGPIRRPRWLSATALVGRIKRLD